MDKNFINNSIIQRLISEGKDLSLNELKKTYRRLCKETHPDITKKDSSDFQQLQSEYEIAKKSLQQIKDYYKAMQLNQGNQSNKIDIIISREQIKKKFYDSLHHYTVAGLHFTRLRRKPSLKARNSTILKQVFYWGNLYDPEFCAIFKEYNKIHFRSFYNRKQEERYYTGKKLFVQGLRHMFDLLKTSTNGTYKTTVRYFHDSLYVLGHAGHNSSTVALIKFLYWVIKELEKIKNNY